MKGLCIHATTQKNLTVLKESQLISYMGYDFSCIKLKDRQS